jgi:hypothetical protein
MTMRKHAKAILLSLLTAFAGCSSYFIAQYNPAIDSGATQLQQKVDGFLSELEETSATPAGEYEQHAAMYDELRADIQTLREAALQQRGNDLTVRSLELIENNVGQLETMHKDGISPKEIEIVRTLFDTQFRMLVQLETAKKRKEV